MIQTRIAPKKTLWNNWLQVKTYQSLMPEILNKKHKKWVVGSISRSVGSRDADFKPPGASRNRKPSGLSQSGERQCHGWHWPDPRAQQEAQRGRDSRRLPESGPSARSNSVPALPGWVAGMCHRKRGSLKVTGQVVHSDTQCRILMMLCPS